MGRIVTRLNMGGLNVKASKNRPYVGKDQLFKFGSQYIEPFSVNNILPLIKQNSEGSKLLIEGGIFHDALLALFQLPR